MDSSALNTALESGGLIRTIILFFGATIGGLWWIFSVMAKRYKTALFSLIMLFPFTFYAGKIFGIVLISNDDLENPFEQIIGPTTYMICFLGLMLFINRSLKRPLSLEGKIIELFLWLFAVTLTLSQLINHPFWVAIGLSFGASWQFLIVFYILISLIKNEEDMRKLTNAIIVFALLNIFFRVFGKNEPFLQDISSLTTEGELNRTGSGALGPSVSYAGYLAILISLTIGYISLIKKKKKYVYFVILVLLGIELLNTFTRGGIFVSIFLVILFYFKRYRNMLYKALPFFLVSCSVFLGMFWKYIAFRGIGLNIMDEHNFSIRILISILYFQSYYFFTFFGNGIFKPTLIYINDMFSPQLHNGYLEILDACGPFPFILFIIISLYSLYVLIKICLRENNLYNKANKSPSLKPFFLIALIQWIVYANTSATSILYYYPYEGICLFWIICFSGVIYLNIDGLNLRTKKKSSVNNVAISTN